MLSPIFWTHGNRYQLVENTRQHRRRNLATGRTAVAEIAGRCHIVGLFDVSVGGAFLSSRVAAEAGQALSLRLLLPGGTEMRLACELVRSSDPGDEIAGRPPGMAVRFVDLDAEVVRRLEDFVAAGFLDESLPRRDRAAAAAAG